MRTIERRPRTLLVWDRDPLLTVYALRLLRWPGPTAAIAGADADVSLLDLRTMEWSPALRPNDVLPAGIDRVAVVGGAARAGAATSVAVPTGARAAWLLDWLARRQRIASSLRISTTRYGLEVVSSH
jgi:hypothetical protein